ncbi:MAG: RNA polymerase sigma factor [Verrucomicrobiota bacterium]
MICCDLDALRSGDPEAWDALFDSLWPVALAAAHARLGTTFPEEIEDVTIEALEEIAAKMSQVKTIEEFPKLARSIAGNLAVSRWRSLTAKKRGAGQGESMDASPFGGNHPPEPQSVTPRLDTLDLKELRKLLAALQTDLKPGFKAALDDFFLEGLSYEEISRKRGWPIGTIGVYIQRGLAAMRQERKRYPNLLKEAAEYLRLLLW